MGPSLRRQELTLLLDEATALCCKLELTILECLEDFLWDGIAFLQISIKIIRLGRGSYTDPCQEWGGGSP